MAARPSKTTTRNRAKAPARAGTGRPARPARRGPAGAARRPKGRRRPGLWLRLRRAVARWLKALAEDAAASRSTPTGGRPSSRPASRPPSRPVARPTPVRRPVPVPVPVDAPDLDDPEHLDDLAGAQLRAGDDPTAGRAGTDDLGSTR